MWHISKAKGGFMVVNVSKNGEPLSTSEILKSKNSCWKNIVSQHKGIVCQSGYKFMFNVQDDTEKVSVVYEITMMDFGNAWKKKKPDDKPHKKYVPKRKK